MISEIISSRDREMLEQVSENIKDNIGAEQEIIAINNEEGKYGICKAYNTGAQKSRFDILCFMHEDIIFHTRQWGEMVIRHLSNNSIGLIGVAGGIYKSKSIEAWGMEPIEYARMNLIQDYKDDREQKHLYSNPFNESVADVATVDGLWLCTRKEVWRKNGFDEINFTGFHFYDLDFSLQVIQSYRVCVVYDVLMEHKSEGSVNKSWIKNAIIFHQKWKHFLPYAADRMYDVKKKRIEQLKAKRFLNILKANGYDKKTYLKYYIDFIKLNSFGYNARMVKDFILRRLALNRITAIL
jgi:glycosyltransferase involved in cell wall biosynthesis